MSTLKTYQHRLLFAFLLILSALLLLRVIRALNDPQPDWHRNVRPEKAQ